MGLGTYSVIVEPKTQFKLLLFQKDVEASRDAGSPGMFSAADLAMKMALGVASAPLQTSILGSDSADPSGNA